MLSAYQESSSILNGMQFVSKRHAIHTFVYVVVKFTLLHIISTFIQTMNTSKEYNQKLYTW